MLFSELLISISVCFDFDFFFFVFVLILFCFDFCFVYICRYLPEEFGTQHGGFVYILRIQNSRLRDIEMLDPVFLDQWAQHTP